MMSQINTCEEEVHSHNHQYGPTTAISAHAILP